MLERQRFRYLHLMLVVPTWLVVGRFLSRFRQDKISTCRWRTYIKRIKNFFLPFNPINARLFDGYEINDVVCFPIFIKENYNKRIEKQRKKIPMFMILTWL